MREILFRGKRVSNGKWVEGGYCRRNSRTGKRTEYYISECYTDTEYNVIPETIGQYTGLTDKNGVKIFEGDIVEYPDKSHINNVSTGEVYFDTRFADYRVLLPEFYGFGVSRSLADIIDEAVVIGNIHDNFGLLKGEAE